MSSFASMVASLQARPAIALHKPAEPTPVVTAASPAECGWNVGASAPMVQRYRPGRLAGIFGQERLVRILRGFVAKPYSCAFLLSGETGTGKTSAAMALAAELGCAIEHGEMGGVWTIASGEQSADAVRDTMRTMGQRPFYGSGWQVIIVNECDRMTPAAETIWLDILESIPARCVVVFSTNAPGKLSARFRDRCQHIPLASGADCLPALRSLLASICAAEGRAVGQDVIERICLAAVDGAAVSFRRAVQSLQMELA